MKVRTITRFILLTLTISVLVVPLGLVNTFAATTVSVSHYAGYGGAGMTDGPASSAQFIKPAAVTFDKDDNAYVVDQGGIRKITPSGYVSTIYRFSVNGTTNFCSINLDKKDVLWIVDCPGTMVMRISVTGNLVNQFSLYTGNNGWIWNDHGAGFLPDGRLLIPVWYVGKILAASETGQVSDYFANTVTGNCNGSPRPVGLICPSGLAVSDSGEVLFRNDGNQVGIYKIDNQRNIVQLGQFGSTNSSIRFHQGSFYIATAYYGSSNSSLQISKLNSSYSTEKVIYTGDYQNNGGVSFALNSKEEMYFAFSDGNQVQAVSSPSTLKMSIGNAGYGGLDGKAASATFSNPSGITEDQSGNIYVKDWNGIRKISTDGIVSTIYRSELSRTSSALLQYGGRLYFKDNSNYIVSIDFNGNWQRHYLLSTSGEYISGTPREMAIDNNGNIYTLFVRNSDWTTRYLRRYSLTGSIQEYPNITLVNSDPAIAIDSNQNLLINSQNTTKRYTLDGVPLAGNSFFSNAGYSVVLAPGSNGDVYTLSRDQWTAILNKVSGNTIENLISGSATGSSDTGKSSSFNGPTAMIMSKSGDLYISDTGNNVIRKVSIGSGVDSTPTPTPTPSPTPSSPQKVKPNQPTFSLINIVGNKINIDVNLGSSASTRPDTVYLVAPKLGILDSNRIFGNVSGSKASWSIDFDKLLSGTAIPLKVVGIKDGVESEPTEQNFSAPAAAEKLFTNKQVPSAPRNIKTRIVGTSAIITAESTVKAAAVATSAYFVSSSFGNPMGNSIIGEVIGTKVLFEIPLKTSMAGKTFPFTIFLTNEVGKSLPVQSKFSIPAGPKIPTGTVKIPVQTKAPKTVLCLKGAQTRTFAATSCPPGWKTA